MKLRIHYDLASVPARLQAWGHPYHEDWDLKNLSYCLVAKLYHPDANGADEIVGYIWYHWQNAWAKRLEMHICVNPAFHGRWLTRRTYHDMVDLARLCDAHYLVAHDNGNEYQARLLRRGGYEPHADGWYALPIPENH